jgi:hypothetical protein
MRQPHLTNVYRSPGDATPWHLMHPLAHEITLCGALLGNVKGNIWWGAERERPWQCRRCTRLWEAPR